jgi:type II secretory pathway pseudopilin PulG
MTPTQVETTAHRGEQGWALLGLLLALGVMSIVLVSAIVPNISAQVQREKEAEMLYRGEQMALGIARYYGRGQLAPIQIFTPPAPLPYLTDLSRLRDGVTIGVRELKFVRPSAMIDPVSNSEWEPVRARDPRIMKFLQAWAAETLVPIPTQYLLIAGPPQKSAFKKSPPSTPPVLTPPSGGQNQGQPAPGTPGGQPGGQAGVARPPQTGDDDDDDDDDDDVVNDPLAHLFSGDQPGQSNAPIVGVAPKRKGKAINTYFGLENYDEWVFMYIPKNMPINQIPQQGQPQRGAPGSNQRTRPQVPR